MHIYIGMIFCASTVYSFDPGESCFHQFCTHTRTQMHLHAQKHTHTVARHPGPGGCFRCWRRSADNRMWQMCRRHLEAVTCSRGEAPLPFGRRWSAVWLCRLAFSSASITGSAVALLCPMWKLLRCQLLTRSGFSRNSFSLSWCCSGEGSLCWPSVNQST